MDAYLNLGRDFNLVTDYSPEVLSGSHRFGVFHTWPQILEGRFSIVVAPANYGKTTELKHCAKRCQDQGKAAIFVPLRKLSVASEEFDDVLDAGNQAAYRAWKIDSAQPLTLFIDSLDEAVLASDTDGLRRGLRRVLNAIGGNTNNVSWVLSTRPAMLTELLLHMLQDVLNAALYQPTSDEVEELEFQDGFYKANASGRTGTSRTYSPDEPEIIPSLPRDQIKIYCLQPLSRMAAAHYLGKKHKVVDAQPVLEAASTHGLFDLIESPGGLDIVAYMDLIKEPPRCLTDVFDGVVKAMQSQQRKDPREEFGLPGLQPDKLEEAMNCLACASVLCQLPNLELSTQALSHTKVCYQSDLWLAACSRKSTCSIC